jgi:hypothetical protein
MGFVGFTRHLQRNGAWFPRIGVSGGGEKYAPLVIQPQATAPTDETAGSLWIDSATNQLMIGNGTTYVGAANAASELVTAANVITAIESGKVFYLNSATGFVSTLPAPAAGQNFRFVVGNTPPTSGNHTVVTNASANIIDGIIVVNGASVPAADEDTISFVASTAVAGDWIEVRSDGTNWYVSGQGNAAGSITATVAS